MGRRTPHRLPDKCLLAQAVEWLSTNKLPVNPKAYIVGPQFNPESHSDAVSDLFDALAGGDIVATGVREEALGVTSLSDRIEIKRKTWEVSDIDWSNSKLEVEEEESFLGKTFINTYSILMLKTADLLNYFDLSQSSTPTDSDVPGTKTPPNKLRAGRKQKYDWDEFFAELVVRANLDCVPESQAELVREMAQWCLDIWGEEPSESILKAKVRRIYLHPRMQGRDES